jgi:MoaA/NifB/PqqE/SkfB family radical SAM enzyme
MSEYYEQSFLIEYPHISELENMVSFCRRFKTLYVYGASENCQYLAKYLSISEIEVAGYMTTTPEYKQTQIHNLPKITADSIDDFSDVGIILGLSEKYQEYVISLLADKGCINYFCVSEHNKQEIARCLRPQAVTKLIIEINVCDHCNLKCRNCDHYSNLVDEEVFLDVAEYEKDIKRLSDLTAGSLEAIKLVGGEPLLHPDICEILRLTRKHFPFSRIPLITNGILLLSMSEEFWQCLADERILLHLTEYPIKLDMKAIDEKIRLYGVYNYNLHNNRLYDDDSPKYMTKFPFVLSKDTPKFYFIGCHHRFCSCVMKRGKIYACPPMAYVEHFNKAFGMNLQIDDEDTLDIYSAKTYREIADFLTRRANFCDYCDIKSRYSYKNREVWDISKKSIEEYI